MKIIKLLLIFIVAALVLSFSNPVLAAETNKYGSSSQDIDTDYYEEDVSTVLPESYSSVDKGYVTSVKNQGNSDICWAYASTSTFESLLLSYGLFFDDLSAAHMDKWATPKSDNTGWLRQEGEGGLTYIPCGYYTSWNGPAAEDDSLISQGVTSIIYLDKSDKDLIKKTIMKSGAVTANLGIVNKAYSKDKCSYCLNRESSSIQGHTLSVVGWDDNYSKYKFDGRYSPENNGAWLCKNSWGENNSIGGYLWVSYEDYYIFDNNTFSPSFGIKSFVDRDENYHLYQNEHYGATYEFIYAEKYSKDITYLNVFDFSENGNVLDKVVFETISAGAKYTLYYIPLKENIPTTDKKRWRKLGEGTVDYMGYICADVESVLPQSKGAIAVELNTEGTEAINSVGVDEWLIDTDNTMLFTDVCTGGNGYVIYNDTIEDIKDFYKNNLDDDIGGNLVIKAITDEKYDILYGDTNLDGEVSIVDATLIQKKLAKMLSFNIYQDADADFDCDGKVNISDVTAIQKYLAKIV